MTDMPKGKVRARKLVSTIRVLSCLFMARTFGEYRHSVGGPDYGPYAVYVWRGHVWHVPTGPAS